MTRSVVLTVDAIPSQRWDLALELLEQAAQLFLLAGDPPVGLQRHAGWPRADGRIHVSIYTQVEPPQLVLAVAQHDVDVGLMRIARAEAADARLSRLFDKYGVVYEYLHDYGHGAVKVGDVVEGIVVLL